MSSLQLCPGQCWKPRHCIAGVHFTNHSPQITLWRTSSTGALHATQTCTHLVRSPRPATQVTRSWFSIGFGDLCSSCSRGSAPVLVAAADFERGAKRIGTALRVMLSTLESTHGQPSAEQRRALREARAKVTATKVPADLTASITELLARVDEVLDARDTWEPQPVSTHLMRAVAIDRIMVDALPAPRPLTDAERRARRWVPENQLVRLFVNWCDGDPRPGVNSAVPVVGDLIGDLLAAWDQELTDLLSDPGADQLVVIVSPGAAGHNAPQYIKICDELLDNALATLPRGPRGQDAYLVQAPLLVLEYLTRHGLEPVHLGEAAVFSPRVLETALALWDESDITDLRTHIASARVLES